MALLILVHVASAFVGHWLLIFPLFWGAESALAPFPHADPISLRSQAIVRFHVGNSTYINNCKIFRDKKIFFAQETPPGKVFLNK
jgi:hypothetical protein